MLSLSIFKYDWLGSKKNFSKQLFDKNRRCGGNTFAALFACFSMRSTFQD